MKKNHHNRLLYAAGFLLFLFVNAGCKKSSDITAQKDATATDQLLSPSFQGFKTVVLNANVLTYGAKHVNPHLHNAWGMSADDEGEIWVSSADGGLSFVYDTSGKQLMPSVIIPSHDPKERGNPTGNLYNETQDFVIPGTNEPSEFIFASEDGTISAWNDPAGASALIVADNSGSGASYKGITMATDNGDNFIYVANFTKNKIDVFDKNFNQVFGKSFTDPNLPAHFTPFNIYNIDGMLFVTYARQTADGDEDSTGAGLGIVNVFNPDGTMVKRFATRGSLNAPWGIADAEGDAFGVEDPIFIGNFGDGRINIFDHNGNYKGQLMSHTKPLAIEGLWAINAEIPGARPTQIFFTAGPNDESDGVFGYLEKQ